MDSIKKYKFLDWLRCFGVCMIVYDHLGPLRNPEWMIAKGIGMAINIPLGIIQYFGALGVCLFFIISGFLTIPNSSNGITFVIKKSARILLNLFMATVCFFFFNKLISFIWGRTYWDQYSLKQWTESATLICFLLGEDSYINGAIWYLFPLLFFDILFGFMYNLVKKNTIYYAVCIDALYIFLIFYYCVENKNIPVQMQWLIFALVPIFGILIRAVHDKKVAVTKFIGLMVLNYLVLLASVLKFRTIYYSEEPYLISLGYALLIFIIGLLLEKNIEVPSVVAFASKISFSVYLLHMTFGSMFMSILGRLNFTVSFLLSVGMCVILAWLFNRYIEKYIQQVIKKIK